mgnify:CR=1 FL=1
MYEMEMVTLANATLEELCEIFGVDPEELAEEVK